MKYLKYISLLMLVFVLTSCTDAPIRPLARETISKEGNSIVFGRLLFEGTKELPRFMNVTVTMKYTNKEGVKTESSFTLHDDINVKDDFISVPIALEFDPGHYELVNITLENNPEGPKVVFNPKQYESPVTLAFDIDKNTIHYSNNFIIKILNVYPSESGLQVEYDFDIVNSLAFELSSFVNKYDVHYKNFNRNVRTIYYTKKAPY